MHGSSNLTSAGETVDPDEASFATWKTSELAVILVSDVQRDYDVSLPDRRTGD